MKYKVDYNVIKGAFIETVQVTLDNIIKEGKQMMWMRNQLVQ